MEKDELKMLLINGFNQDKREVKEMSDYELQELYSELYLDIEDEFFRRW